MPTLERRANVRLLAVYTAVFLAVAALVFQPFWSQGRTFIYYFAGQERDGFTQHYTAIAGILAFFAGLELESARKKDRQDFELALHRASDRRKDLMERESE